MIKVHTLPSCEPLPGIFYPYLDGVKQEGEQIESLVFYSPESSTAGEFEGPILGVEYKVMISQELISKHPEAGERLEVEGVEYRLTKKAVLRRNSPIISPFYELELKETV